MQLDILYQDQWLVAVNKPSGLLVHRTALARREKYFAMQLLRDQLGGEHVFPLHRLDRPTSGVLLFARSSEVAAQLQPLFAQGEIDKQYLAVVRGFGPQAQLLDYPLKEELDKIADKNANADKAAQPAVTAFRPLARVELPYAVGKFPTSRYGLLECRPHTGRKHQIRRHLHHLSAPIVGDTTHGDGKHNRLFREQLDSHRLLLHARSVRFTHPLLDNGAGRRVTITAPLGGELEALFAGFGWLESLEDALSVPWPTPLPKTC